MYPPPHHQVQDHQKMIAVIREYPLGMLVSTHNNRPHITHVPMIYESEGHKLVAHIDKMNPQVDTLKDGTPVTVVFKGPDCYISPSIYTTTQLPTWNYIIVHLEGTIRLIHDSEHTKQSMINMTDFLEQPDQRYVLEKDNPRMSKLINYVQAFEIHITSWEGKFKLSQDKNATDQERAKQALIKKSGAAATGFINLICE
ncbi:MAG: FMN-binding negative transcriptional regulator [Flavobacteriaceae bacterium]|nr:FMN-binding negative transcriptional regulator [Flavobacteriaceae bacterium]